MDSPTYGQRVQLPDKDLMPLLDKLGTKHMQQISGLFLHYWHCCIPTILVALNEICNNQALPTERIRQASGMLPDYLATHLNATICYYVSNMILVVCSDAAYLVGPNAYSLAAGYFFLTDLPGATINSPNPKPDDTVQVLCKTLHGVKALTSKAETESFFFNAQEAMPIVTALKELGHPQPPTCIPLETDNSTAHGILHTLVCMKKFKAFDMC